MLTDVLGSSVSGVVLSDIVERAVSEITVASLDVLMRIHSDTVVASVQFKVMFGNIRTLEEVHVRIAASDELRRSWRQSVPRRVRRRITNSLGHHLTQNLCSLRSCRELDLPNFPEQII